MAVLLRCSVTDRFMERMRCGVTICKQIVRIVAMPFFCNMLLPFRYGAHAVIALVFIRIAVAVLAPFGQEDIK